ncbi:SLC13 family permease [Roseibaca sp. Y0-43]|uniref:SLC13 family permease n=1 Tax=Roseibaca sp. Y0-43 TaxID=2816854 RepID=UPI001D0BF8E8|nr:SLC13 family permease [Roseibaca sp. Y0-43]MCC1480843.1 SLC13 family permease [Roseibaca sp. Y0-43]
MTEDQALIFTILGVTMALFLWGRFRHDVVALAALLASVVAGLVVPETAFAGFGHPAVITVACILVLSHGLQVTGAIDAVTRHLLPTDAGPLVSMAALLGLGAFLSGFMNNVGAMALLMPVAIQMAGRLSLRPGQILMPLAFGTILGGMSTLVGTPPNMIVSGFREEAGLGAFAMFDFAPVGASVAVIGVLAIVLVGWRLVPKRQAAAGDDFETGSYMAELRVPEGSKAVGLTIRGFEREIDDSGAQIVALLRGGSRMNAPHGARRIRAEDVLVLEGETDMLAKAVSVFDVSLDVAKPSADDTDKTPDEEIVLRELVVQPGAALIDRSAVDLGMRTRFGLNLLALSREGRRPRRRLRAITYRPGDLLLVQGPPEAVAQFAADMGCLPLGPRDLRLPQPREAAMAGAIMLGAIALVTFGLLPAAVAFALGVLASMVLRTVPPRDVYTAIDWPVVVLLAALIPVAGAMESTGAAALLANFLIGSVAQGNAVMALGLVLVVTMFLSDVMNNAATAAVMCPIALGIAGALGVSPDSFLMAVAIGASCAFLTPIGHQNNTLILGPGGFGFSDYWRLGLPLEALIVALSLPLLLLIWPL